MIPISIVTAASFNPRSLLPPKAWVGHLPFAAWVIREVSPKIFVELGTESGNSFFSFCQSVAEAGISSRCYAVDTWQGDEHAGQYNEEVFTNVRLHHSEHYAGFSHLMRMTFDEAVTHFADQSIGLLHIDGLHTYEAVRHDFDTWVPKLSPGAVVMFHDTKVREKDFGVWQLWKELQGRYVNNLEFEHSHGLGVMQLNDIPEEKEFDWLKPTFAEKQEMLNYFAALGARQLERFELIELNREATDLRHAMAESHERFAGLKQSEAERHAEIGRLNESLAERDRQIAGLDRSLVECHAQITELSEAVIKKEAQITAVHDSISWRTTRPLRFIARQLK